MKSYLLSLEVKNGVCEMPLCAVSDRESKMNLYAVTFKGMNNIV